MTYASILDVLQVLSRAQGKISEQVLQEVTSANSLELTRARATLLLNQLVNQGMAEKQRGKPQSGPGCRRHGGHWIKAQYFLAEKGERFLAVQREKHNQGRVIPEAFLD